MINREAWKFLQSDSWQVVFFQVEWFGNFRLSDVCLQMSMNSAMSGGAATMSPSSCSVFGGGGSSQAGSAAPHPSEQQGPPQPPTPNTPFPLVTHYDMPPAFMHLQETFQVCALK